MSRTIALLLSLTLAACQGERFKSSLVGGGITHQDSVALDRPHFLKNKIANQLIDLDA
jgi:hypothetical protein